MIHVYDFFFLFNLESMTIVSCGLGGLEGLIYLRNICYCDAFENDCVKKPIPYK